MQSKIVCLLASSDIAGNPRNSEGSFIRLHDNRIAFYYTRYCGESFHDNANADIAVCYSSDQGETWTDHEIVLKGPNDGNVMSISMLRLQDGRIMMAYLKKQILTDMVLCRPFCCFSSDEGKSWTEPVCIVKTPGYFVGNNDRLIQLRSGRIIYPVAFTNQVNSGGIDFIYYSDDNGNTWQSSSWILPPADKQNDGSCGLQEPGTVELPENNHLMCW